LEEVAFRRKKWRNPLGDCDMPNPVRLRSAGRFL